jgi:hypothetical protein
MRIVVQDRLGETLRSKKKPGRSSDWPGGRRHIPTELEFVGRGSCDGLGLKG